MGERDPGALQWTSISVKGLASGLKGKVANDVVKPSKGSKAWHWD